MQIEISKEEIKLQNDALNQLEYFSVLERISKYAMSELGQETILDLMPIEDVERLNREHALVQECIELLNSGEELPFGAFNDARSSLKKSQVVGAILSPTELLTVKDSIRTSRLIKSFLLNRQEKFPLLAQLMGSIHENRLFEKHISDAIQEPGEVKDNASKELLRIRQEIFEVSARLRNRLKKILKNVSEEEWLSDDFITQREGRFVLPVKAENKRKISGVIHGISQTGSTVFLEPSEIMEMNNDLTSLHDEEYREVAKILMALTAELGSEAHLFLQAFEYVGSIDADLAKAKYALEFGGLKPRITNENYISLRKVRHPILVHNKGTKNVIPLTIEFDAKEYGYLITGPNAGGKTVALKSVALNIAMALSGIFPLGECETNPRRIFSAIGDQQSVKDDLSTFSSQIMKLRDIIDCASPASLILVDEICSGTDPQEGSALAEGIIDTLIELKSFFIITTHQSSLKSYALQKPGLMNASLEFDEQKLCATYKFLSGIPGNSYAFALANSLGMSKLTIERGKKYLSSGHQDLEKSIAIIQNMKKESEDALREINTQKAKVETIKKDYEKKLAEIKERKAEYVRKAKDEVDTILRTANAAIERAIKEGREGKVAPAEIKADFETARQEVRKRLKIGVDEAKVEKTEDGFAKNDSVTLDENEEIGMIVDIFESTNSALVEFGGLKFNIALDRLSKSAKKKEAKKSTADYIKFSANTSLDLRGMRADEAIQKVDVALNEAALSNVEMMTIIHGKGTGALRVAIQRFLKEHPSVKLYRDGEIVEGGSGVTIVEIR